MNRRKTLGLVLIIAIPTVLFFYWFTQEPKPIIEPFTEKWESSVPHQEVPEGLNSLSSEECGACHQAHYAEWKLSTHANAWTDQQFQAELKKESSPYFCINCHIPLQNQQEFIVSGLTDGDIYKPVRKKNPKWDKNLQQEGINCATCHVRHNAVIGPTGTNKAPHKTIKDPKFLSESLCISCHNANATITAELVCSFETCDEWKAGPYADSENCISCHMKETKRAVVPGYEERKSHYHFFPGSGIPKHDTLKTTMLNGLEFYPGVIKKEYKSGEDLKFAFKVKNEHAGHKVPTGNPDRFILVTFKMLNEKGELLQEKIERIGEVWKWYPVAKKISDNNLYPLEEREYNFTQKGLKKGSYRVVMEVTKHRMDEKTASYNKLTKEYPLKISIYKKEFLFRVY